MNILKQSQRFLAGGNSHSPKYGLKSKHEKNLTFKNIKKH